MTKAISFSHQNDTIVHAWALLRIILEDIVPIVILLLEAINSLYSWVVQCNIIFLQGEGKHYYKKK